MATGIVITVAENLFSVLKSQEFKEICSMFGYESQLDELASTVSTIKAVLLDAESKHQELTHAGREYVERLKDAVYDVDDVIDEFNTMVQKEKNKNGGKTIKKVSRFFSRSNQFLVALNMSREIRKFREKLDSIAKNRQQFGFSDVYVPVKKRQETGSYAREESIIGRDADKEAIVGVLLGESDHIQDNIGFVTIVGMGGLGKTALAQLVYNDNKIKDAFEVRLWVCVSNEFGMEQIFAKMIGKNVGCGMEELQRDVRNVIEGRKYLLVLDDVWDENHNKWVELRDFLMLGGNGSRVLITTRSKAVARAIGNNHTHELQGLSDEYSWHLFEKMAFEQGKAPEDQDLVDIGKKVVKKCANVPLSIRIVGSLLYGQNKSKWLSFISIDFKDLGRNADGRTEEGIMPILKYSYHHLSPSLKSCFSYCALYPKDFKIREGALIWLWMAHGCLDLSNDGRSIEAVGADYFSILHHRCFFQDNEEETNGQTYKMHDLIHDLAQEVAGRETLALETTSFQFDKKIRHLAVGNDGCKLLSSHGSCLGEMKQLRSLTHNLDQSFYPTANKSNVNMICSNLRHLRVLDLSFFQLTSLPNTLGNLSHLRYLDFSLNHNLEILPESITKLHNLLVLNLTNSGVRELPKGLRNLHNLRHLYLRYCTELTHMPVGMDSMTNLQTLSMFVVAGTNSKHLKIGQLKDLRRLDHLQGRLEILFKSGYPYELANTIEESCLLSNKVYLKDIAIRWEGDHPNECSKGAVHEILLQGLRPHGNIEGIEIRGYKGIEIPSWVVSLATFFPCLVRVSLHGLDGLHNLPSLSELLHLKILSLSSMPNIEFIESNDNTALSNALSAALDELPFFPTLEELSLICLPKLKGVWSDDFLLTKAHKKLFTVQSLPRIHKLKIDDCPCLTGIPRCPGLKTLWLLKVHEYFRFTSIREVPDPISVDPVSPNSFSLYDSSNDSTFYLKVLVIDKVGLVNLLFGESLKGIDDLNIHGIRQEIMSVAADLFQKHSSSIRGLTLSDFDGLTSLCGGGIEHLTNLRYLNIGKSDELDLGEGEDCGMTPWKSLKNLGQLCLWSLSQLMYLPEGFQHLTSLHTLRICDCNFESLPEWLSCLSSLRMLWLQTCTELKSLPEAIRHMPSLKELRVWNCELLTDRCREPDGEDWPKISHINHIHIRADI